MGSSAKVKLSVYVESSVHRIAKHAAIDKGTSLQAVVIECLEKALTPPKADQPLSAVEKRQIYKQVAAILDCKDELLRAPVLGMIRASHRLLIDKRFQKQQAVEALESSVSPVL